MSHFYNECECGKYMGGCRCASPDKAKKIISPCKHEAETGELQGEEAYEPKHMAPLRGIDG